MTMYAEIPSDHCLPNLTGEIKHTGLLVNPSNRQHVLWPLGLHGAHDILSFQRGYHCDNKQYCTAVDTRQTEPCMDG